MEQLLSTSYSGGKNLGRGHSTTHGLVGLWAPVPHLSLISSEECGPARHSTVLHTTPGTVVPGDCGNGSSLLVFATLSIAKGWAPSTLTDDPKFLLFPQGTIHLMRLEVDGEVAEVASESPFTCLGSWGRRS